VLSNFIKSYNGKILFNDHNVLEDANYRNYFNFVGQKNSLKDNLSVKNNLKLWEIIYQKNISYSKLLEDFNMSHLVERDVASLSDGQKKCISLLRLNFTESKIWYLDEPFVFLDEENSQILIQKIKNFNTNNGIVIITSNINLQNTFTNEIKI
jgi:heme exporter protein A